MHFSFAYLSIIVAALISTTISVPFVIVEVIEDDALFTPDHWVAQNCDGVLNGTVFALSVESGQNQARRL